MSSFSDFLRSLSPTSLPRLPTSTILPDRRLRFAEAALFGCGSSEQCFGSKRNHRKPRASGIDRFSASLPKHIKTQRLRSGGRAPPSPHQRALPVQTLPGAGAWFAGATEWSPPLRLAAAQRRCTSAARNGHIFSHRSFHAPGHPCAKTPPSEKHLRALHLSPRQPTGARPSSVGRAFQPDAGKSSTLPSPVVAPLPHCFQKRAGICDRSQRAALTMPGGCRAKLPRR